MSFTFADVNGLNGGMSYGMHKAGGEMSFRAGYLDLGSSIVNANASLWGTGWEDLIDKTQTAESWREWPIKEGKVDVVVGVPPCSGFSGLTGKGAAKGKTEQAHAGHKSNACMRSTVSYASRLDPQLVMFESVKDAFKLGRSLMLELRAELEALTGHEWNLTHWLHDGVTMGTPTSRQRYMFVATRGRPFGVIPADEYAVEHIVPLKDAIIDLEPLEIKEGEQLLRDFPPSAWIRDRRRWNSFVDGHWYRRTAAWPNRVIETCRVCEEYGIEWKQAQQLSVAFRKIYQTHGLDALKQATLGTDMAERMIKRDFQFGAYAIRREAYDAPCALISGGGPTYHVHPTQARNFTYRELARVQGWPDDLLIDFDTTVFGRESLDPVWGKAVGCVVAEHAGEAVDAWLRNDSDGRTIGESIGDREWLIDELEPSKRLRKEATQLRHTISDGIRQ